MSTRKLAKLLGKELTASPKKAAVLGLCLLVAAYFWLPLLLGGSSSGGAAETSSKTLTETMMTATLATREQKTNPKSEVAWQQIDQWIRTDPRMSQPAGAAPFRDPFESKLIVKEEAAAGSADQAPTAPTNDDNDVHLVLTSTFTGSGRPTALIGQRTYRIGQRVDNSTGGLARNSSPGLIVSEIHPRHVVLTRGGRRIELHLNDNTVDGVIELQSTGSID